LSKRVFGADMYSSVRAAGEGIFLAGHSRQEEDASRFVVFSAMRAALPVRPRR